jgi:methylated-DNA-[protein]-cysteine S-methyltransferase
MKPLAWAELATPVGPVAAGCSDAGVARVRFGPPPAPPGAIDPARGASAAAEELARRARAELAEYLAGDRRAFGLPLDWDGVPERNRQVLGTLLESAGYGQTITYGELARRSGLADVELPARVAGQIMGSNRLPLLVPCHRVVASDGIGGYSGGTGIEAKRWLLILEGVLPPTLDWEPALAV